MRAGEQFSDVCPAIARREGRRQRPALAGIRAISRVADLTGAVLVVARTSARCCERRGRRIALHGRGAITATLDLRTGRACAAGGRRAPVLGMSSAYGLVEASVMAVPARIRWQAHG
jgi:hypothetical protein